MPGIQLWHYIAPDLVLPTGIIIPFNDVAANIPSGWQQFTASANKIIKAGSSVGSGGSNSVSLSDTGTGGSHSTNAIYLSRHGASASYSSSYSHSVNPAGSHSHTLSLNYAPAKYGFVLIKATEEHFTAPANAALMSYLERTDLTDITPTGKVLADSSTGPLATGAVNSITTNSTGHHDHWNSWTAYSSSNRAAYRKVATGAHTHTGSLSVTDKLKKFYVGVYTDAVSDFPAAAGTIAMWESATPPDGWVLCDGLNGTHDLTGHFIGFDVSKLATKDGDGTIVINGGNIPTAGTHSHAGSSESLHRRAGAHASGYSHTHSYSAQTKTHDPAHYKLVFITPKP